MLYFTIDYFEYFLGSHKFPCQSLLLSTCILNDSSRVRARVDSPYENTWLKLSLTQHTCNSRSRGHIGTTTRCNAITFSIILNRYVRNTQYVTIYSYGPWWNGLLSHWYFKLSAPVALHVSVAFVPIATVKFILGLAVISTKMMLVYRNVSIDIMIL